jgi:hypothetical protein
MADMLTALRAARPTLQGERTGLINSVGLLPSNAPAFFPRNPVISLARISPVQRGAANQTTPTQDLPAPPPPITPIDPLTVKEWRLDGTITMHQFIDYERFHYINPPSCNTLVFLDYLICRAGLTETLTYTNVRLIRSLPTDPDIPSNVGNFNPDGSFQSGMGCLTALTVSSNSPAFTNDVISYPTITNCSDNASFNTNIGMGDGANTSVHLGKRSGLFYFRCNFNQGPTVTQTTERIPVNANDGSPISGDAFDTGTFGFNAPVDSGYKIHFTQPIIYGGNPVTDLTLYMESATGGSAPWPIDSFTANLTLTPISFF